jgi:peroxiredoxin
VASELKTGDPAPAFRAIAVGGSGYMGTERSTFVIGPDQKIMVILRKVKPGEHVKELLAVI